MERWRRGACTQVMWVCRVTGNGKGGADNVRGAVFIRSATAPARARAVGSQEQEEADGGQKVL